MILLVSSTAREAQGVVRAAGLSLAMESPPLQLYWGGDGSVPLALAVTGIGRANIEDAMARWCQHLQPRAIASLGFGGALTADLPSGALVLADRVVALSDGEEPVHSDSLLLASSVQVAAEVGLKAVVAPCLTSPALVSHPQEKARLGQVYGASVVDMGSYWVGHAAAGLGVPFISLQAVLQPLAQSLPPLVTRLMEEDTHNQRRLARRYALARPWRAAPLLRLAYQSYLAERRLRQLVVPLVSRVWQQIRTQPRGPT